MSRNQANKLLEYDWPGNVRELKNVIERAVILSPGKTLHLELSMRELDVTTEDSDRVPPTQDEVLTEAQIREFQKSNMIRALGKTDWRVSGKDGAAELLGIKPTTLADRIRSFGINKPTRS
jgi:transcriptional regulator with GAF, ATPase, and Fis domain